jgi:hypothetical protein
MYKPVKKPVTLRLDADVLAWFHPPDSLLSAAGAGLGQLAFYSSRLLF